MILNKKNNISGIFKVEYEKAMKNYNATYSQFMASKSRVKTSNQQEKMVSGRKGGIADQNAVTGVFIQPVEDEDPFEMAGKRLAAIRYGQFILLYLKYLKN